MKLTLQRTLEAPDYTLGELSVDGSHECFTLEDPVRTEGEKIHGQTAIPAGTYRVVIDHSPRFGRVMPRLLDVPDFAGIRIHTGNTAEDTQGCILVGKEHRGSMLLRSREAYRPLLAKMADAIEDGDKIHIAVVPAPPAAEDTHPACPPIS